MALRTQSMEVSSINRGGQSPEVPFPKKQRPHFGPPPFAGQSLVVAATRTRCPHFGPPPFAGQSLVVAATRTRRPRKYCLPHLGGVDDCLLSPP